MCTCKADAQRRLALCPRIMSPRFGSGALGELGESKDRLGHLSLSFGKINPAAPAWSPESGGAHLVWRQLCCREKRLLFLSFFLPHCPRELGLTARPGSGSEQRRG